MSAMNKMAKDHMAMAHNFRRVMDELEFERNQRRQSLFEAD